MNPALSFGLLSAMQWPFVIFRSTGCELSSDTVDAENDNKDVCRTNLFVVKGINARVGYGYIGRGGFGFVFKGELKGAAVALKLLYKTRHNELRRGTWHIAD